LLIVLHILVVDQGRGLPERAAEAELALLEPDGDRRGRRRRRRSPVTERVLPTEGGRQGVGRPEPVHGARLAVVTGQHDGRRALRGRKRAVYLRALRTKAGQPMVSPAS